MTIDITSALLSQPCDCLILVHPQIYVLEIVANQIQGLGLASLNVSKELSAALMPVSFSERCRFSQKWMMDTLAAFPHGPVLCTCTDLLFEPSFEIDPLALLRHAARVTQLIILWSGDYSESKLSYSIPEHHHYRTWKLSDYLLRQPLVIIQRITTSPGV